jgi:hypothetical protein
VIRPVTLNEIGLELGLGLDSPALPDRQLQILSKRRSPVIGRPRSWRGRWRGGRVIALLRTRCRNVRAGLLLARCWNVRTTSFGCLHDPPPSVGPNSC